jgi:hypothetical protein
VLLNALKKEQLDVGYCVWIIISNVNFVYFVIYLRYIQLLLIIYMALVFGARPHQKFSNILANLAFAVFRVIWLWELL